MCASVSGQSKSRLTIHLFDGRKQIVVGRQTERSTEGGQVRGGMGQRCTAPVLPVCYMDL